MLDRTPRTQASGLYNLWLRDGGWVRLGAVVDEQASTVTRVVIGVTPDTELRPGVRASWSGIYYRDPADAGLDALDVVVETPVGPAPAWLIHPSDRPSDQWAIHIQGMGSSRAGTLRGVLVAADAGLTSLVVSYRNDGEGPRVGSGRSTLGAAETDDIRAAARYAVAHGARRIVLFGWSMGAAIALELATDAEFDGVIDRLVLDSPVLDWAATIDANCARAGLPSWFGAFGRPWLQTRVLARLVGLEAAVPLRRFNSTVRADALSIRTLILHGAQDSSAPHSVSARLARLRPDVVQLESFSSDHTLNWNSDPVRWRLIAARWAIDDVGSGG
ncbi:alpha/beta hydrolase family protein [Microbacterium phosphatis]|uniref:alpha/beta hydrolase family protein n=1 Tax=Microbacterium phosphatis TaxID=3140248 RepID=UPI003140A714